MLGRLARQVLMPEVGDLATVEALLRHPAFRDRAVLEVAISSRFFEPFDHQEVVVGERFEARARLSRVALAGVAIERVSAAADAAFEAERPSGEVDSLLDAVRAVVARATVDLAIGDVALVSVAQEAIADIDRGIKMVAFRKMAPRRALANALAPLLDDPERWPAGTYLDAARSEALALPLRDRVDHVAAVFLATGTIQVSDVVTHALIALAQTPSAQGATDEAVVAETIRVYPVNASTTRIAARAAEVGGQRFEAGEPFTFVPARFADPPVFDPLRAGAGGSEGSWSFGVGPRACPARRVALTLATAVLGRFRRLGVAIEPGYPHRRSLALTVRARLGPGPAPERTPRAARLAGVARYVAICAESYPATFVGALPELARAVLSDRRSSSR